MPRYARKSPPGRHAGEPQRRSGLDSGRSRRRRAHPVPGRPARSRTRDEAPHAVILDVSGVETLDPNEFASLRRIIAMVRIMGSESVLVGLQPGVVSALIEVDGPMDEGLQDRHRPGCGVRVTRDQSQRSGPSLSTTADAGSATTDDDRKSSLLLDSERIEGRALSAELHRAIRNEMDVRRVVLESTRYSQEAGFDETPSRMIATAVSELARNILKYAGSGSFGCAGSKAGRRRDRDRGVGPWTRHSGPRRGHERPFSSSGTLGLGLPGVKRMMDEFSLESVSRAGHPGDGAQVDLKTGREDWSMRA